jgi:hypothetical protein
VGVVRIVLLVLGALSLVGGLLLVLGGGPGGAVAGIWLVIQGSIVLLAVALERTRYRSEQAERTSAPPGPGGGEAAEAPLEPRFQPTDEVFMDPTSRRRMRVWLDPVRGERRYRAED